MSLIIVNEDSLDVSRTVLPSVPLTSFCCHATARGEGRGLRRRAQAGYRGNWGVFRGQMGGWVGLFVCSQVQVIKVSGVSLAFFFEKGMKRDH